MHVQHELSDVKIAKLKSFLKDFDVSTFGVSFPTKLVNALTNLAQIEQKRQSILKHEISYIDTLDYYTKTLNGQFLDFIVELSTLSFIKQNEKFNAYTIFLQSKELAGIERAVINNVLTRGQFGEGMYERFTELVNDQAIYNKIFSNLANEGNRSTS